MILKQIEKRADAAQYSTMEHVGNLSKTSAVPLLRRSKRGSGATATCKETKWDQRAASLRPWSHSKLSECLTLSVSYPRDGRKSNSRFRYITT